LIPNWLIIVGSLAYVALLFAIAHRFDQRATSARSYTIVYSLSLAVFCTSWAFFGTIQQAAMTGWFFAPTYVGTLLLLFLGWRFLSKLVSVSQYNQITSISDFISSRYGKSQRLAGVITFITLVALIPYIALQLKALNTSYLMMTTTNVESSFQSPAWSYDSALYITLIMAVFSIIFGTRRVDATEHQTGIIHAIAFESIVKLLAFITLGIYICYHFFEGVFDVFNQAQSIPSIALQWQNSYSPLLFWTHALLGLLAIFCLPRQFHVLVVENRNIQDIKAARWIFSGYLVLINLFILPIAIAGLIYFNGTPISSDMYILAFPLSENSWFFSMLAYLGGFSAATGMIIIVSIVLSTMVSNDIVMPIAMRLQWLNKKKNTNLQHWLLNIRRAIIFVLLLLAFLYYRLIATSSELASIGLLSMSLVAQFAPAIIGGLYWKQANKQGVILGLTLGIAIWSYTLLIPALVNSGYLDLSLLVEGPFSISWLSPTSLFGNANFDPITSGVFWSLVANTLGLIYGSLNTRPTTMEKLQAIRFVSPRELNSEDETLFIENKVTLGDLFELCQRFIGLEKTHEFFGQLFPEGFNNNLKTQVANPSIIEQCQKRLSRVIGGSSAQIMMDTVTGKKRMALDQVVNLVDEASQVFTFNRSLLQSAMENISHGISVIDKDLKLVAWNRQYQKLFNYPDDLLTVGRPIADLLRFNAEQGLYGEGDIESQINKRLHDLRKATPHTFERIHNNSMVLKIQGNPMPGGGFVTVFIDITELRQKQQELARINATLEQRVQERTQRLLEINQELDRAKRTADEANQSKTRFLAAASHDILQPINAASLLTEALYETTHDSDIRSQLDLIQRSLNAADELLTDLLEISKVDAGVIQPHPKSIPLYPLLKDLCDEFDVIAKSKQLHLKLRFTPAIVYTDAKLLRRIIQNLISNAIRYSHRGKILVAARKRDNTLRIDVWDTGIGIAEDKQQQIFEEFTRLEQHKAQSGHGLGLAIVKRYASLLNYSIHLRSKLGKGSCFSIFVPLVDESYPKPIEQPNDTLVIDSHLNSQTTFSDLTVLCVDNDPSILQAMEQLLSQWGIHVYLCHGLHEVRKFSQNQSFDLLLVDYHLDDQQTGFDVIDHIRQFQQCPAILITADRSETTLSLAKNYNVPVLTKPIKAMKLRALIKNILRQQAELH
jgi:Na+/proline symporter/signal transduction histidine kinase/CheY-like chemotaxis protein